jgi:hypothetical protein
MKSIFVALIVFIPYVILGQDKTPAGFYDCYGINEYFSFKNVSESDTIKASLLITTRHMGIAFKKIGYVVIQSGADPKFLDCQKIPITEPYEVWLYHIIKETNYEGKESERGCRILQRSH